MKNKSNNCDIYKPEDFNVSDFDTFLHKILRQIRFILEADAGTIYTLKDNSLKFNVFQNDTLSYEEIFKKFQKLKDSNLSLNDKEKYLCVEAYVTNQILIGHNLDETNDKEFCGIKEYDEKLKYKTKSIITAPLVNPLNEEKLGVIQLLNKNNGKSFDEKDKNTLSMVAMFIALSISKAKDDVEKLKTLNEDLFDLNKKLQEKVKHEVLENEKKTALLHHQARLASLGEMIGNIAHQWRQPLSAISTIASALSYKIEIDDFNKESSISSLDQIVENTKYLSHTIDDFRDFYKANKEKKAFSISKCIKQTLNILNASLTEFSIKIELDLDDELEILSYENEFKQAIISIFQNSKEAFSLKNIKAEDRYIFVKSFKEKGLVTIEIKDTANGMKESIMEKVFERGFTTKEQIGGTGVGLYITKHIIDKSLKGMITVENSNFSFNNKEYQGALFTIRLYCK